MVYWVATLGILGILDILGSCIHSKPTALSCLEAVMYAGRLSDIAINTLQNYFGMTIKQNKKDLLY